MLARTRASAQPCPGARPVSPHCVARSARTSLSTCRAATTAYRTAPGNLVPNFGGVSHQARRDWRGSSPLAKLKEATDFSARLMAVFDDPAHPALLAADETLAYWSRRCFEELGIPRRGERERAWGDDSYDT